MDEIDRAKEVLRTTPPSCVADFHLTPAELPIEWDESTRSVWQLACKCSGRQGRVLGYALGDYAEVPNGTNIFISPIGFQCTACSKVTEIIDTDLHGYHSEVAKREGGIGSATYRGEGGDRVAWSCPKCTGQVFSVSVAFIFWDAVLDLAEDQPEWPIQEFFLVCLLFARCAACEHVSQPTDFGKL